MKQAVEKLLQQCCYKSWYPERADEEKKAIAPLASDYDALDVANKYSASFVCFQQNWDHLK